jgi:hypothetical protein
MQTIVLEVDWPSDVDKNIQYIVTVRDVLYQKFPEWRMLKNYPINQSSWQTVENSSTCYQHGYNQYVSIVDMPIHEVNSILDRLIDVGKTVQSILGANWTIQFGDDLKKIIAEIDQDNT